MTHENPIHWSVASETEHVALLLLGFVGPSDTGNYKHPTRGTVQALSEDDWWACGRWASWSGRVEHRYFNDPLECARYLLDGGDHAHTD